MRNLLDSTALALALALVVTPALADQHAKSGAGDEVTFLATQDEATWTATTVKGSKVSSPGGFAVGTVSDLIVRGDGVVIAVIINIGGVLGVGGKEIAVPFGTLAPKPEKDGKPAFVLNATKARIDAAPTFKRNRPTMSEKAMKMMKSAREKMEDSAGTASEAAKKMMESGKQMMESGKQMMEKGKQ